MRRMRTYRAVDVARHILSLSGNDGLTSGMTNMKLQKLVFFSQLAALQVYDTPIHSDPTMAWDFGPVVVDLYERVIGIVRNRDNKDLALSDPAVADAFADAEPIEDADALAVIQAAWNKFKEWTAYQLSDLTHRRNSPWTIVYTKQRYDVIPLALIKERGFGDPD